MRTDHRPTLTCVINTEDISFIFSFQVPGFGLAGITRTDFLKSAIGL